MGAINPPITLRLVTSEQANGGTDYDVTLSSSYTNISADWRAASTPVWTALAAKTSLVSVHWRVFIDANLYSTPTGPYPYSPNRIASVHSTAGRVEVAKGLQFFSNLITSDVAAVVALATPIVP